jgi:hypothetical protein
VSERVVTLVEDGARLPNARLERTLQELSRFSGAETVVFDRLAHGRPGTRTVS